MDAPFFETVRSKITHGQSLAVQAAVRGAENLPFRKNRDVSVSAACRREAGAEFMPLNSSTRAYRT
jgi:hypothetical protein